MASSMPPEIWFTILDYLPRNDQLRISQVSHDLCAVARRTIYCDVTLRSNNIAVEATLALLARDHSVAQNVGRLHIYTTKKAAKKPTWFDPAMLAGMAHLHHLKLTRTPFHTAEDELKFNNTVSKTLPSLRKLEYRSCRSGDSYNYNPDPGTHVPVLQIDRLHEITWSDPEPFVHPSSILPSIHASRETLTHIHIPVHTYSMATHGCPGQLFSIHFPRLSTLHFGGWNITAPISAALTNFLIAHPLIDDLQLCFSDMSTCHISPNVVLGPGTLPNLRRLTADAFNLGIFLRSGVLSLQTLEHLHTGLGYFEKQEEERTQFVEMFRTLEMKGGLPELKSLELQLNGLEDGLENARWITGFGKLCPKIERFWGDDETGWTAVMNPDVFASYCNLQSLVMLDPNLDDLIHLDKLSYVKLFAARNPSLMDLQFYKPKDTNVINYRMERDMEGRITGIVMMLDGVGFRWF